MPPKDTDAVGGKKKAPAKVLLTEAERALEALRQERAAQKKKLKDLRMQSRREQRKVVQLHRKAAKVTLREVVEISLVKYAALAAKDTTMPSVAELHTGGASSSSAAHPGDFGKMAAALCAKAAEPKKASKAKPKKSGAAPSEPAAETSAEETAAPSPEGAAPE
jgi:hypothetical protein